jgi:hypothetical protein
MFLAKKLNDGAGTPALTTDPQFNYVTMLLHGDGTNGAQNNTFLDSRNNFTITRNGNPTQGSFSPYGSNWSNYFNGSSGYLSTPSSTSFNIGSNDACVELWVNSSNTSDAVYGGQNDASSSTIRIMQYSGTYSFTINDDTVLSSGVSIAANSWVHLAVTITGGVARMFVNGILRYYITGLGSVITRAVAYTIGSEESGASLLLNGYISNYRFVNGSIPTAYQTSSSTTGTTIFTVPTTPLTAITNTVLLTCQSNRFIDNSSSPKTITANGASSVQRFNPFGTSTAYSTSVIGGSGYFDGSGDWLNYTGSSISTSVDFTFSIWFYHIGTMSGNKGIFCSSNSRFGILAEVGNIYILASTDIAPSPSVKIPVNQWNYLAITRTSNTLRGFLNGTQVGGAVSNSQSLDSFRIGSNQGGEIISNCYMSDARVLIGTGGTTISVPTAPLTAITNTNFLCSFTNGAIFDNAMMNDLETVNDAKISTSVKKFGTGSLAFDGTGDWLYSPTTTQFNPSKPFTIEFWTYPISYASNVAWINGNSNAFYIETFSSVIYVGDGANNIISGSPPTVNVWTHVALSFDGTTYRLFYNGVSQGTSTTLLQSNTLTAWYIGAKYDGSRPFNGYIDDLRITKGYARYTANFTAPTAAFFDTGPV